MTKVTDFLTVLNFKFFFLTVHLDIIVYRKTNFKHNLFLVYFVNLYTFRAYLGPSRGGKPYVYNNWYLQFFLDDCLLSWLDPARIVSTNCCIHMVVPPDDGPRYAQNMYRLTKCTKNKLCIKLVFLYTFITVRYALSTKMRNGLSEGAKTVQCTKPKSEIGGEFFVNLKAKAMYVFICTYMGARGGVVVKALRYKPAGRGFDFRRCHWNFSVT